MLNMTISVGTTAKNKSYREAHLLLAICFPELAMIVTDISKGYCLVVLAKKLHLSVKSSTAHAVDEVQDELIKTKLKEVLADTRQKTFPSFSNQ